MVASVAPRSLGASQVIRDVKPSSAGEGRLTLDSELPRSDRADAAKIDRAIERAKNSTAAIIEIRKSQSLLLDKIQSSNDAKRVELISEFNTLNSEVDRITSNSTYNGTNLPDGSLFQLQSAKRLYYGVVSLPRYSSLNSLESLQNSAASISTTTTSLESALESAYLIDASISSRDLKSQKIIFELSKSSYLFENNKRNRFTTTQTLDNQSNNQADIIKTDPVAVGGNEDDAVDLIV